MANFSPEVIRLAQESEKRYGVPASVTLAQYATESGYGKSWLAKNANNYFGMIAGKNSSKKIYRSGRYWQVHESMEDSFDRHGQLLASSTYSGATAGATDAFSYIDAIAPIYAPESDGNSGIVELWKTIIREDNLTQYDSGKYGGSGGTVSSSTQATQTGNNSGFGSKVLSVVVQAVSILLLLVFAVVLFMGAFDIQIPRPGKGAVKDV